ncbi:MAG: NAD(P)H-dependent oxidoreductase [Acidaminococcaceae bacterium]|jgi:chromate reductase|nr:NAD(P)H-dependent oxidoreductase [Acidaminococcaceae bacterium]MCI2110484.1 NAD(P)H-dependent oxidoreductase [Acidaminococcaceae bacterium]
MKILAIVGSLRKDSFNRQLAQEAKAALAGKAELEILDYHDIPLLNQDIEHPAPEAVAKARAAVTAADGIWFFTPEYNHFFPGVLKNVIDWLSRPQDGGKPQVLAGKPAAVSGITPGMSGTGLAQDHLVTLISFLNMHVMNAPRLTIPNCLGMVKDGKLELGLSKKYLDTQASAFVEFINAEKK